MAFIVEMWGAPAPEKLEDKSKNRSFSCHANVWGNFLKLGQDHGWKPAGTLPHPSTMANYIEHGKFDSASYEPEEYSYAKMVLSKDAAEWANALERALKDTPSVQALGKDEKHQPVLLRDDMTEDELIDANRDTNTRHISEFISFLRKGGFGFAWDD